MVSIEILIIYTNHIYTCLYIFQVLSKTKPTNKALVLEQQNLEQQNQELGSLFFDFLDVMWTSNKTVIL